MKLPAHLLYVSVIAVLAVLLYRQCKSNNASILTQIVHDHVTNIVHDTPKVMKIIYSAIPTKRNTNKNYSNKQSTLTIPDLTVPINSSNNCDETVIYNDTARNKYGYAAINDTVRNNRIQGRSVLFDLDIPTTERTITKAAQKERLLMGGFDIGFGVGAGLGYKSAKDKLYTLDYMLTQHGGILILGYKTAIKIHL